MLDDAELDALLQSPSLLKDTLNDKEKSEKLFYHILISPECRYAMALLNLISKDKESTLGFFLPIERCLIFFKTTKNFEIIKIFWYFFRQINEQDILKIKICPFKKVDEVIDLIKLFSEIFHDVLPIIKEKLKIPIILCKLDINLLEFTLDLYRHEENIKLDLLRQWLAENLFSIADLADFKFRIPLTNQVLTENIAEILFSYCHSPLTVNLNEHGLLTLCQQFSQYIEDIVVLYVQLKLGSMTRKTLDKNEDLLSSELFLFIKEIFSKIDYNIHHEHFSDQVYMKLGRTMIKECPQVFGANLDDRSFMLLGKYFIKNMFNVNPNINSIKHTFNVQRLQEYYYVAREYYKSDDWHQKTKMRTPIGIFVDEAVTINLTRLMQTVINNNFLDIILNANDDSLNPAVSNTIAASSLISYLSSIFQLNRTKINANTCLLHQFKIIYAYVGLNYLTRSTTILNRYNNNLSEWLNYINLKQSTFWNTEMGTVKKPLALILATLYRNDILSYKQVVLYIKHFRTLLDSEKSDLLNKLLIKFDLPNNDFWLKITRIYECQSTSHDLPDSGSTLLQYE